jgi:hypothetical protein
MNKELAQNLIKDYLKYNIFPEKDVIIYKENPFSHWTFYGIMRFILKNLLNN